MLRAALLAFVLIGLGCHEAQLESVDARLEVDATEVSFGAVPVGTRLKRTVVLRSGARHRQLVELRGPEGFSHPEQVELLAGAVLEVPITFQPTQARAFGGDLELGSEGASRRVRLAGRGESMSACPVDTACRAWNLDAASGTCVPVNAPQGTACEDACLVEGSVCVAGECVGRARTCDDNNPCTVDACSAAGCTHTPVECPGVDDPCLAALCNPAVGCTVAPVADGTVCGRSGCGVADVCIAGACVARAVPEGAPCGLTSPCAGPGVCRDGQCDLPEPGTLAPLWRQEAGVGPAPTRFVHSMALGEDGTAYVVADNRLSFLVKAVAPDGDVRWWREPPPPTSGLNTAQSAPTLVAYAGGALLVATYWNGLVSFDPATGAVRWIVDIEPHVLPLLPPATSPPKLQSLAVLEGAEGSSVLRLLLTAEGSHWRSRLFAAELDSASGAVLRVLELASEPHVDSHYTYDRRVDVAPSIAADHEGNLFVGVWRETGSGRELEIVAFGANLAERWRAPGHGWVYGLSGDTLLVSSEVCAPLTLLDAGTGVVKAVLPVRSPTFRRSSLVASERAVELAVLAPGTPGCGTYMDEQWWSRWDPDTGDLIWKVPLGVGVLVHTAARTAEGGTLLVTRSQLTGAIDLVEISAEGQLEFRCRGPRGPASGVALHDGRWLEWETGVHGWTPALRAWSVPGRTAARDGWPVPTGSLARTWCGP